MYFDFFYYSTMQISYFCSFFQVCDFHRCLKNTGTSLEKKEEKLQCYGDHFPIGVRKKKIGGIQELQILLNRSWYRDTEANRNLEMCQGHVDFFIKDYNANTSYGKRCLCPCDHKFTKGGSRNQRTHKVPYQTSQACLERGKQYAGYEFPVCLTCKNHIEKDAEDDSNIIDNVPMDNLDIDPAPGPSIISEDRRSQLSQYSQSSYDSSDSAPSDDSEDSDYHPGNESQEEDEDQSNLTALNQFLKDTKKKANVECKLMMSFENSDPSRKRKLEEAVAQSIHSTLAAITPIKKSRLELFQATLKSKRIEKKLSDKPIMPKDVSDVMDYHNFVKNHNEEIRALATLTPNHKFSFLKLFNDGEKCWKPKLTVRRMRTAKMHAMMTGYGMAPICRKEITRQRIKPEIAVAIYEYVMSRDITKRVAFGTYKVKKSDGSIFTVAKHIRNCSQEELIRKIVAYLRHKNFPESDIPKRGYLRKILSGVPAMRSKKMRGITAAVEYGKCL